MEQGRVARTLAKPLPPPEEWEYVEVRTSKLHGRGLFAARTLPKGTYIMEYRGEKVSRREGTKRTYQQWKDGRIYVFQLNKRTDIDGSPEWNIARLANYSCEPNAESQNERGRKVWIVATKDIRKGTEITYDYNLDFEIPPAKCLCGSKHCIGYIVGEHDRPKLLAWLQEQEMHVPKALLPKKKRKKATAAASRKRTKRTP